MAQATAKTQAKLQHMLFDVAGVFLCSNVNWIAPLKENCTMTF